MKLTDKQIEEQILSSVREIKSQRQKDYYTIGKIITILEKIHQRVSGPYGEREDCNKSVKFYKGDKEIGICLDTGSYEAYYEDLVIYTGDDKIDVDNLLSLMLGSKKYFTGENGGDFLMTDNTVVWISEYCEVSGLYISGHEETEEELKFFISEGVR